jgi:hypothetical protein
VRGGDEGITQIANALKTAQSNVTSLTTAGTTNENSDLQAQIDQERARREVEKTRADIAEGSLQAFGGSGDLGAGGANAARAAANIVINTLHPGDSSGLERFRAVSASSRNPAVASQIRVLQPGSSRVSDGT